MKEDEWILHIEELSTQDAEASFVSYFQLKKNNVPFFFFFRKVKKIKKAVFFSQVMSLLSYMCFLCSKKSFCLLPTCLVFSAICQNLTVNFLFYHLFSTHEKKSNYSKYSVRRFFLLFISILKSFIPNTSLKIWQHNTIFDVLQLKHSDFTLSWNHLLGENM